MLTFHTNWYITTASLELNKQNSTNICVFFVMCRRRYWQISKWIETKNHFRNLRSTKHDIRNWFSLNFAHWMNWINKINIQYSMHRGYYTDCTSSIRYIWKLGSISSVIICQIFNSIQIIIFSIDFQLNYRHAIWISVVCCVSNLINTFDQSFANAFGKFIDILK